MHDIARKPKHTDLDGGVLEKNTIRAALSPKIARTIFTGMVSNKLAYVIREIGKNAHEVSPKGKPWTLKLPTPLDTRVVFRDFGPGLSHHFMKYRYPKIGESTRDKNGVNGMSGLGYGSKSPLAVLIEEDKCGSYNVNSYQKGHVRYYLISLTEKGDIQIKLMGEAETTEPDGLEVSLDIAPQDITDFTEAAHEILWSFTPRPVITPAPPAQWSTPLIIDAGPGWTRYEPRSVPWFGAQVRVDECVMYPIDLNQIENGSVVNGGYSIVFDVARDAVDATASREALQYTTKTKESIKAAIDAYVNITIDAVQKEIDQQPTYFKAFVKLNDLIIKQDQNWRRLICRSVSWKNLKMWNGPIPSLDDFRVCTMSKFWASATGFRNEGNLSAHDLRDAEIVVQIGNDRSFERLKALDLVGKALVWFRVTQKQLPHFLKRFGLKDGDYHLLNNVKLPPRVKGSIPSNFKKLPIFNPRALDTSINLHPVDISQPQFYVRGVYAFQKRFKKRYRIEFCGHALLVNECSQLVQLAIEAGIVATDETSVVIVPTAFAVPANWTEWSDKILKGVQSFFDVSKTKQKEVGSFGGVDKVIKYLLDESGYLVDVEFPKDLRDMIDRGKDLLRKSKSQRYVIDTIHDRIYNYLSQQNILHRVHLPTEIADYTEEFQALIRNKYLLLPMCFTNDPDSFRRFDTHWDMSTQKLKYYLKLIQLAHPLIPE